MYRTDTLAIGADQAGLSMSRCRTDYGRDHVVVERGRLARDRLGTAVCASANNRRRTP